MRLFPDDSEREPKQTRYWVMAEVGGPTAVTVVEAPDQVEERLMRDHPAYRLRKIAADIISKAGRT